VSGLDREWDGEDKEKMKDGFAKAWLLGKTIEGACTHQLRNGWIVMVYFAIEVADWAND
jgi:hypothetical protein